MTSVRLSCGTGSPCSQRGRGEEPSPVIPVPGSNSTGGGISQASLVRFRDLLRGYGVDPGSFSAGNPDQPESLRQGHSTLGVNSSLAISTTTATATLRTRRERGTTIHSLPRAARRIPDHHATRLAGCLRQSLLQQAHCGKDDQRTCNPNAGFPAVDVGAGTPLPGPLRLVSASRLDIRPEITDNFGVAAGNHQLTFGLMPSDRLVDDAQPGGLWFLQQPVHGARRRSEPCPGSPAAADFKWRSG